MNIKNRAALITIAAMFSLASMLSIFIQSPDSSALSGSDFKAGRIMDDVVFFDGNAMTASQIQVFLNSKVANCVSGHTCLKDYRQDTPAKNPESGLCSALTAKSNQTASQIINDVAKACRISPKVILVILQKEGSLVTKTAPTSTDYAKAMGYGCPDSGPNHTANCNSLYFGFFNQVFLAARAFQWYSLNNGPNYKKHQNNYIQYHPNTACGGSWVYIENQATAGLYNYTPYQPNAATLAVGLGETAHCGAYGNKNFWWIYNIWFGSTLSALIRTESSPALFYNDGSKRFAVPTMALAAQFGLGLSDVRFVSQQEMDSIPQASSPLSSSIGQLVKSDDDTDASGSTVFLISGGKRFPIASMGQFDNFGFSTSDIRYLPLPMIYRLTPSDKSLSNLVKGSSATMYGIENGKRRIIFEPAKLNQLNTSDNISFLSDYTVNQFAYGQPHVDGDYVIRHNNGSIRLYKGGNYHPVGTMERYHCLGLDSIKKFSVPSFTITNGTSSGGISCLVKNSTNEVFVAAGNKKFPLANAGDLNTTSPADSVIDRLPEQPLKAVIKSPLGSTLAVYEDGIKRPIPSMSDFSRLGFTTSNSITTIPNQAFTTIPSGPLKLGSGTVTKDGSSKLYVINDDQKLHIPSMTTFHNFGFSTSSIVTVSGQVLNAYPTDGSLALRSILGGQASIVESKTTWRVPSSLEVHFGFSGSTPVYNNNVAWKAASVKTISRFIKSSSSSTVYYVENNQRRPISSWSKLIELGGENNIKTLSSWAVQHFPPGPTI